MEVKGRLVCLGVMYGSERKTGAPRTGMGIGHPKKQRKIFGQGPRVAWQPYLFMKIERQF